MVGRELTVNHSREDTADHRYHSPKTQVVLLFSHPSEWTEWCPSLPDLWHLMAVSPGADWCTVFDEDV